MCNGKVNQIMKRNNRSIALATKITGFFCSRHASVWNFHEWASRQPNADYSKHDWTDQFRRVQIEDPANQPRFLEATAEETIQQISGQDGLITTHFSSLTRWCALRSIMGYGVLRKFTPRWMRILRWLNLYYNEIVLTTNFKCHSTR